MGITMIINFFICDFELEILSNGKLNVEAAMDLAADHVVSRPWTK